jgi:hypothetical protein
MAIPALMLLPVVLATITLLKPQGSDTYRSTNRQYLAHLPQCLVSTLDARHDSIQCRLGEQG